MPLVTYILYTIINSTETALMIMMGGQKHEGHFQDSEIGARHLYQLCAGFMCKKTLA